MSDKILLGGKAKREAFRKFVVGYTGCNVQEGENGKAWPCGTCANALFGEMGLDSEKPEYSRRNKPIDRSNEVWRAVLQIRDAILD